MTIRRIETPEELQRLIAAAKEDDHGVFGATHVIVKNDEIVGYLSAGSIPSMIVWLHTQKTDKFDAEKLMEFYENGLRFQGAQFVMVPVPLKSPFHPFMERLGYVKLEDATIFVKGL